MRRFEGRVALITGASRGIGLAVAERLVAEGATVVITGRKPESLAAAAERLDAIGAGTRSASRARPTTPDHRAEVFAHIARAVRPPRPPGQQRRHQPGLRPGARDRARGRPQDPRGQRGRGARLDARRAVAAGLSRSIVNIASVAGLSAQPRHRVLRRLQGGAHQPHACSSRTSWRPASASTRSRPPSSRPRSRGRSTRGREAERSRRSTRCGRLGEPEDVAGPGRVPALRRRRLDHRPDAHHRRRRQRRRRRLIRQRAEGCTHEQPPASPTTSPAPPSSCSPPRATPTPGAADRRGRRRHQGRDVPLLRVEGRPALLRSTSGCCRCRSRTSTRSSAAAAPSRDAARRVRRRDRDLDRLPARGHGLLPQRAHALGAAPAGGHPPPPRSTTTSSPSLIERGQDEGLYRTDIPRAVLVAHFFSDVHYLSHWYSPEGPEDKTLVAEQLTDLFLVAIKA